VCVQESRLDPGAFAHDALEHQAPRHHHVCSGGFQRFVRGVSVQTLQISRMVLGFEIVRKRHTLLANEGEFFAPLGDELVIVGHGVCR
jgi:hypothetical protein